MEASPQATVEKATPLKRFVTKCFVAGVLVGLVLSLTAASVAIGWIVFSARRSVDARQHPEKTASMPEGAVWVGGADGGWWIWCKELKAIKGRFFCRTFLRDGSLASYGEYVLRVRLRAREFVKLQDVVEHRFSFRLYDGSIIHLVGDLVLVPDGAIVWPFVEAGRGKVVCWREGRRVGREIEYSRDLKGMALSDVFDRYCGSGARKRDGALGP